MTRKDYVLIAEALRFCKPESLGGQAVDDAITNTWRNTCSSVAAFLARDNGRFDGGRFLKAAGYQ